MLNRSNDTIFVYGTLKRYSNNEMHQFLASNADFVDTASFCGKLYQVEDYPGAVPSSDSADRVYGDVYLMRHADDVLSKLDRYEECGSEFSQPNEYYRSRQRVLLSNGDEIDAWIYLYNYPTEGLLRIESAEF